MSGPIEIGLQQIYDKLCALESRVGEWRNEDQQKITRLELRVEFLEQGRNKTWSLIGPWIAAITSIVVMTITLLAK